MRQHYFTFNPARYYGLPTRLLHDMRRDIDDVFARRVEENEAHEESAETWAGGARRFMPLMDVETLDNQYRLSVEIPGVDPEDIDIDITDDVLTISGEKKLVRERDDGLRTERSFGRFTRSIRLSDDINQDEIDAVSRNGVLLLTLPKKATATQARRRITVRSEDTPRQLNS